MTDLNFVSFKSVPMRFVFSRWSVKFCCRQGLLCDVQLVADDIQLSAHRVVLAACSHYFNAMFTSKLSESRTERIILKQIDGKTLSALVDFIYTSEIRITEENVQV